jgi:hypothetical protein
MLSQTKDIVKNIWGLAFPCDLSLFCGSLLWFLLSEKNHAEVNFQLICSHHRLTRRYLALLTHSEKYGIPVIL